MSCSSSKKMWTQRAPPLFLPASMVLTPPNFKPEIVWWRLYLQTLHPPSQMFVYWVMVSFKWSLLIPRPRAPCSKPALCPMGHKMIFLIPFSLGFDPMLEDRCVTSLFIRFPSLPQVYHWFLATIGAAFGLVSQRSPPCLAYLPHLQRQLAQMGCLGLVGSLFHIVDDNVMLQWPDGSFFR